MMKINKSKWLLSQMDLSQILADPSLQNVPNLEANIRKTVVDTAIDSVVDNQNINIPFGPKEMDKNGNPLYSDKQLKAMYVLDELSMWGKFSFDKMSKQRQRGLFVIPCTTENKLYDLLTQFYDSKDKDHEYSLIHYLGKGWSELQVGAGDPLDNTILDHFLVAIPYIDRDDYLSELFSEFYDRLSITATI